ncbi:MAG: hypothetical protein ACPG31_03620 [Planctomycetota bacterium]
MHLSLFLLSALLTPTAQEPEAPNHGLPHPVYPVFDLDGQASPYSERPHWVSLEPSWFDAEPLLYSDIRAALLERRAGAAALTEDVLQSWVHATRPGSLMVNYRILVDGYEALVGREAIPMGRGISFGDLTRKHSVLDFDVEIASGSGIFDPVMGTQVSGASLALQALPVPGRGWALETAMVYSKRLPGSPIALDYVQVEGKDRLITRLAESGGQTLLVPGAPLTVELPALGPGRVTMEIIADSAAPAGPVALTEEVVFLAAPTLALSPHWDRVVRGLEENHVIWVNRQGDILFEGADAMTAATATMQVVQRLSNPISVKVGVEQVIGGVEGARTDLATTTLEDTRLAFAQGTLRDALIDWDVEVAQVARIGDPVFHHFFSGWEGELSTRRLAGGGYEVDLDLRFTVVDVSEPKPLRLAAYQPGTKGYEGEIPASPAHTMNVEVPEVREVRFQGTYETDADGRLLLIRSANAVLEDAGRLRLELQLSEG